MIEPLFYFWRNYRIHILLWTIYIIYESVLVGLVYDRFGKFENYATHFSLNISLFYIHSWILNKLQFSQSRDYIKILLVSIIEIIIYIPVLAQLNNWFTDFNRHSEEHYLGMDHRFILGAIYRSLFFIMFSTGFWFLSRFLREQKISQKREEFRLQSLIEKEALKSELAAAETAYVRSQINPHFLFNTISFVHRRIAKLDSEAGELLVSLTKMMRYTVNLDQKVLLTSIRDEIGQVENLIQLFQIREEYGLSIHFDYDESILDEKILPLAILTLCENVFKHGDLHDERNPAEIVILPEKENIIIRTKNVVSKRPVSSTSTGLKNLTLRVKQQYGNTAALTYETANDIYTTVLRIPKNQT